MLLGFLGCLGALKEIKAMLLLVSGGGWGGQGTKNWGPGWRGGGCCAAISWGSRRATWSHHILRLWGSRGERGDSAGPSVPPWCHGGPADPDLPPPFQYFGILLLLFAAQITVAVIVYTQRVTVSAALPGGAGGGGGSWGNTGAMGQSRGVMLQPLSAALTPPAAGHQGGHLRAGADPGVPSPGTTRGPP